MTARSGEYRVRGAVGGEFTGHRASRDGGRRHRARRRPRSRRSARDGLRQARRGRGPAGGERRRAGAGDPARQRRDRRGAAGRTARAATRCAFRRAPTCSSGRSPTASAAPCAPARRRRSASRAGKRVTRSITMRAPAGRGSHVTRRGRVTSGVQAIEVRDFTGAAATVNRAMTEVVESALAAGGGGCSTVLVANARDRAVLGAALKVKGSAGFKPPSCCAARPRARGRDGARQAHEPRRRARLPDRDRRRAQRPLARGPQRDAEARREALDARRGAGAARARRRLQGRRHDASSTKPPTTPGGPDTTAPVVSLTQPADGAVVAQNAPVLGGVAGTATGDLPHVTVRIYSGPIAAGLPRPDAPGAAPEAGHSRSVPRRSGRAPTRRAPSRPTPPATRAQQHDGRSRSSSTTRSRC